MFGVSIDSVANPSQAKCVRSGSPSKNTFRPSNSTTAVALVPGRNKALKLSLPALNDRQVVAASMGSTREYKPPQGTAGAARAQGTDDAPIHRTASATAAAHRRPSSMEARRICADSKTSTARDKATGDLGSAIQGQRLRVSSSDTRVHATRHGLSKGATRRAPCLRTPSMKNRQNQSPFPQSLRVSSGHCGKDVNPS
jgi:hypothetical protein